MVVLQKDEKNNSDDILPRNAVPASGFGCPAVRCGGDSQRAGRQPLSVHVESRRGSFPFGSRRDRLALLLAQASGVGPGRPGRCGGYSRR